MLMNKDNLNNFRKDFEKAMIDLEEKYNIKIDIGGITFTRDSFTCGLKAVNMTEDGIDQFTQDLLNDDPWFKSVFNKRFKEGRHAFKIIGYKPSKKNSIVCKRDDNETYYWNYNYLKEKDISMFY